MFDRQKWMRSSIIAAAAAFAGLAWTNPGLAQIGSPNGPIACRDFARNGYGDWMVLRPTTLHSGNVAMRVVPGQTFMPSQFVGGIEPTAVLDSYCGNQ